MKKLSLFFGFLLFLLALLPLQAAENQHPKFEFRGVWIATVYNTDWPSKPGLSSAQQIQEFRELLDFVKSLNLNAVIVQIRSMGEAFYPSQYYPWSTFLTGKDNQPPSPYYDPLAMMIREAHQRGLEFHAWFNPFRLASTTQLPKLSTKHPAKRFAHETITYNNLVYFDPGNPKHRQFIVDGIAEVVQKYDIDAVHIDDYFYPYPVANKVFNDTKSYKNHNPSRKNLADWRRDNINCFIKELRTAIKQEKAYVKFGVSPFGIWRNQNKDKRGSATNAIITGYDSLYADAVYWLRQGWLDYIIPQNYWHFGQKNSAYEHVLSFWRQQILYAPNTHLYVGHAVYKSGDVQQGKAWLIQQEIPRQITYNRRCPEVKGSAFYNISALKKNPLRLQDYFKKIYYEYPALIPKLPNQKGISDIQPIRVMDAQRIGGNQAKITFVDSNSNSKAAYYIIYRFKKNEPFAMIASHIVSIVGRTDNKLVYSIIDRQAWAGFQYIYYVVAVNRMHQESRLSNGAFLD